jgi:hypothetical protein
MPPLAQAMLEARAMAERKAARFDSAQALIDGLDQEARQQ